MDDRLINISVDYAAKRTADNLLLATALHTEAPSAPARETVTAHALPASPLGTPALEQGTVSDPALALHDMSGPAMNCADLPTRLAAFCLATAEALQVPNELVLINALACTAVAGQGTYKVAVRNGYEEPLNIFALTPLPPGERKSPTVQMCKKPLQDWERAAHQVAVEKIAEAQSKRKTNDVMIRAYRKKVVKANFEEVEAIQGMIQDLEAECPEVPEIPRLFLDDVTPEALVQGLERQHGRIGVIESESGLLDILAGRYSSTGPNLDAVLKCWSGEPVTVDRKNKAAIALESPLLTLGLSPQPEVLQGLAGKRGFRGRGFLARFLYVLPKSRVGQRDMAPPALPDDVRQAYDAKLRSLLGPADIRSKATHPESVRAISLTEEAYALWCDFSQHVESAMQPGGRLELMADWGGKLPGQVIRLAGLLHIWEHEAPDQQAISPETMAQTLRLAESLIDHAKLAFSMMGVDPHFECASRIWNWLVQAKMQEFSERDAYRILEGRYPSMTQIRGGLHLLLERGLIIPGPEFIRDQGRPGRAPSPRYIVAKECLRAN